jgi:hypothetical protein
MITDVDMATRIAQQQRRARRARRAAAATRYSDRCSVSRLSLFAFSAQRCLSVPAQAPLPLLGWIHEFFGMAFCRSRNRRYCTDSVPNIILRSRLKEDGRRKFTRSVRLKLYRAKCFRHTQNWMSLEPGRQRIGCSANRADLGSDSRSTSNAAHPAQSKRQAIPPSCTS